MKIRRGYKYCLKTTPAIEHALRIQAGHCRFVWNEALRLNRARLDQGVPLLWYNDMAGLLRLWKQSDERGFLQAAHSQALQQALRDLAQAFADGFDRQQPNKRMPRSKRKGDRNSFRYPQGFRLGNKAIYLPKVGWVNYFDSRRIEGTPKNVTVSYDCGHWYVSIQTERDMGEPVHESTHAEGIDLGVQAFAATASGELVEPVNAFQSAQTKLKRLQRRLARRVKFSANWHKTKARITRLHHKIACIRADYLHKLTTALSKNHAIIAVEALQVTNMSASARGDLDEPGHNVRAKAGLNRSILDQGWGEFQRQLAYKLAQRGGRLVEVSPAYTSQRCACCGHVAADNRINRAAFRCQACGHEAHADTNAACNILVAGLVKLGLSEKQARRFVVTTKIKRPQGMGLKPVEGNAAGHPEAGTVGGFIREIVNTTHPAPSA